MDHQVLALLRCPACASSLACQGFADGRDGVVWCIVCHAWYPVQDEVLELLSPALAYTEDRARFSTLHAERLRAAALPPWSHAPGSSDIVRPQQEQQSHFDWYAENDRQTYTAYERTPFWQAEDALAFDDWRLDIRPGTRLLDVGCAQGRSAANLKDLDIEIVGFDISKALVRQAQARAREEGWRARASFFVADASRFPLANGAFDYVLVYGVLHHLPDPAAACREIARVLKPDGLYFGSENNRSVFRALFDALQRLFPIWLEEAGTQPLISRDEFSLWLGAAGLALTTRTRVFLPPHLCNYLSAAGARRALAATDAVCGALPFLRDHGGLILVRAEPILSSAQAPF